MLLQTPKHIYPANTLNNSLTINTAIHNYVPINVGTYLITVLF